MNYKLEKASNKDIERIKEYKRITIYDYAHDLSEGEIIEINNYVNKEVLELLDSYQNILVNDKKIGCLLVTKEDEWIQLNELYLEKEYRNKGIGTGIITNLINSNDLVHLCVYKDNKKAIALYKKLGFKVIEETESRYYMEYNIKEN